MAMTEYDRQRYEYIVRTWWHPYVFMLLMPPLLLVLPVYTWALIESVIKLSNAYKRERAKTQTVATGYARSWSARRCFRKAGQFVPWSGPWSMEVPERYKTRGHV